MMLLIEFYQSDDVIQEFSVHSVDVEGSWSWFFISGLTDNVAVACGVSMLLL